MEVKELILQLLRSEKSNVLIEIIRGTSDYDGSFYYDAYVIYPDFAYKLRLGQGSAWSTNLKKTLRFVLQAYSDAELLADLGDWPLWQYFDKEDGQMIVVHEPNAYRNYDYEKILAKDVPNGTHLMPEVRSFFKYWLGEDVIDDQKLNR